MSHLLFLCGPAETFLCSKHLRFNIGLTIRWAHKPVLGNTFIPRKK